MAYTNEALGKALEDLTAAYQHFIENAKDAAIAAMGDTVIAQIKQDAKEHIASELAAQKTALEKAIETAKIALHNSAIETDKKLKQTAEEKKGELAALITAAENALNGQRAALIQEIKTTSENERLRLEAIKKEVVSVCNLYEVCATASAEKIKTVNIADFSLKKGIKICIQFTKGNTADEPRLNISGTGDKPITMDGTAVYTGCFDSDGVYEFVYDGTNWECVSGTVRTKGGNSYLWYTKYRNGLLIQKFTDNGENNPQTFVFPIAYRDSEYMITYSSSYLRARKIISQLPTMCKVVQYNSVNDNDALAAPIQIMTIGY